MKPDCGKCTSTGRKVGPLHLALCPITLQVSSLAMFELADVIQCDGYSMFYEDPNPPYKKCTLVKPNNSAAVVIPNAIFEMRGTYEERRCFEFFLTRTASQLSGFWDSDFWNCLILRATHHQPAIRHAVLALGSLHERFEAGDRSVMNPIWDKGTYIPE